MSAMESPRVDFGSRLLQRFGWLKKLLVHPSVWVVLALFAVNLVFAAYLFPRARKQMLGKTCAEWCEGLPTLPELQVTFSATRFRQILVEWEQARSNSEKAAAERAQSERKAPPPVNAVNVLTVLKRSIVRLDFPFPVAYAALLVAAYFGLAQWLRSRERLLFPLAAVLAAVLDWVENILTLAVLGSHQSAANIPTDGAAAVLVLALSMAAALKWALVALLVTGLAVAVGDSTLAPVLWTCRYGVISVLLGSLPFIGPGQGRDVLRGLVESETDPRVRAFSFFFLLVWAGNVWYWSRILLQLDVGRPAADPRHVVLVPRALGVLTLALPGVAFLLASNGPECWNWTLTYYAGVCWTLAAALLVVVIMRRKWLKHFGIDVPAADQPRPWRQQKAGTKRVAIGSVLLSAIVFILIVAFPVGFATRIGTLSVLCMAAANAVFFGSATVFLGRLWNVPLVSIALALAAVFSFWNDNHSIRLHRDGDGVVRPPERKPLGEVFQKWVLARQAERPGAPIPVFLVAAEGGGIRAAYWTAIALARVQDQVPEFGRQAFAISSVSGGSLGAAVFTSLLTQERTGQLNCSDPDDELKEEPGYKKAGKLERCAQVALSPNFLAPGLAKMLAPDFAQWFFPFPIPEFDRARALEDAWARGYENAQQPKGRQDRLSGAFQGATDDRTDVPLLLLNVAHVQTGHRLLHSPFSWPSGKNHPFPDVHDMASLLNADVPLKTAVHNSARFTYVSPAGILDSRYGARLGHAVDGGYFENSGAATLMDLIAALESEQKTLPAGPITSPLHFYVLYLCNSPSRCGLRDVDPGWIQAPPARRLAELSSPLQALLAAREARGSLALAQLRREPISGFLEMGTCRQLAGEEKKAPLPLGWQLSKGVRRKMSQLLHIDCPAVETCPGCERVRNVGVIADIQNIVAGQAPAPAATAGLSKVP